MKQFHDQHSDQARLDRGCIDRRTRICIWVIMLGLANFLLYAIIYFFIGGASVLYGHVRPGPSGLHYFLNSGVEVSAGTYIYSGIHSISIWLTVAAVMLAMLTLAKERIISSMRSTVVRGRTLITVLATIIAFTSVVITIWFTLHFIKRLTIVETSSVGALLLCR